MRAWHGELRLRVRVPPRTRSRVAAEQRVIGRDGVSKLRIIDWKATVRRGRVQLAGDRIHATAAGYTALIHRALPLTAAAGDVGSASVAEVLANRRIILTAGQRADLARPGMDARLLATLKWIGERHSSIVTALRSDHYPGTNHEAGRAIDIGSVDGEICRGGRSGACAELVRELAAVTGPTRSTELIYCWDPDPADRACSPAPTAAITPIGGWTHEAGVVRPALSTASARCSSNRAAFARSALDARRQRARRPSVVAAAGVVPAGVAVAREPVLNELGKRQHAVAQTDLATDRSPLALGVVAIIYREDDHGADDERDR